MEAQKRRRNGINIALGIIIIGGMISLWLTLLMMVPHVTILLTIAAFIYGSTDHGKVHRKQYILISLRWIGVFLFIVLISTLLAFIAMYWKIVVSIIVIGIISCMVYK